MYEKRIQYALDNLIRPDYFLAMSHEYHLKEEEESGKSDLAVTISNDNLCIYNFDIKKKCNFFREDKKHGLQKSVDHVLFEKTSNGWNLHLIEMKSSVGGEKWLQIKQKVRASYLNSLALANTLGIKIQNIYTYTTYEKLILNFDKNTTNPKLFVTPLGQPVLNWKKDEWDKNRISIVLDDLVYFPHRAILMNKNADGTILEGNLEL